MWRHGVPNKSVHDRAAMPMVHSPPDQSASKFLMAGMILGLLV